jgi:hypothetical protein
MKDKEELLPFKLDQQRTMLERRLNSFFQEEETTKSSHGTLPKEKPPRKTQNGDQLEKSCPATLTSLMISLYPLIHDMLFQPHGTILSDFGMSKKEKLLRPLLTTVKTFSHAHSPLIIDRLLQEEETRRSRSGILKENASIP